MRWPWVVEIEEDKKILLWGISRSTSLLVLTSRGPQCYRHTLGVVSYSVKKSQSVGRLGFKLVMFLWLYCCLCAVWIVSAALCWQVRWITRRGDLLVAGLAFSITAAAAALPIFLFEACILLWWSWLLRLIRSAVFLHTVNIPRLRWVFFPFRGFCLCAARLWGPKRTALGLQITIVFIIDQSDCYFIE